MYFHLCNASRLFYLKVQVFSLLFLCQEDRTERSDVVPRQSLGFELLRRDPA